MVIVVDINRVDSKDEKKKDQDRNLRNEGDIKSPAENKEEKKSGVEVLEGAAAPTAAGKVLFPDVKMWKQEYRLDPEFKNFIQFLEKGEGKDLIPSTVKKFKQLKNMYSLKEGSLWFRYPDPEDDRRNNNNEENISEEKGDGEEKFFF